MRIRLIPSHRGVLTPFVALAFVSSIGPHAIAQSLAGSALVHALQQGGYILVMRHASSPPNVPARDVADAANVNLERQLDANGRASAAAMGRALRTLKIPLGEVLSSPTYRAMETARLMELPNPRPVVELGDQGKSMRGASAAQAAWLENRVAELPHGTNTLLITHQPNIAAAFPQWAAGLGDGETLVFGPDGRGGATLVARIKMDEWPRLSADR